MPEDNDDRVNRILRGNAGVEPKPRDVKRKNMLPPGVSFPSLGPGGIGRSYARLQRPSDSDLPAEPSVPTAPPNMDGRPREFRREGEPKPKPYDYAADVPKQTAEENAAKRLQQGDLSRKFNGPDR